MENKYLDKIIGSLVRSTNIDYDKKIVSFPPSSFTRHIFPFPLFSPSPYFPPRSSFSTYCRNQFGLTDDEIDYVWNEYKSIIKDKIENGE